MPIGRAAEVKGVLEVQAPGGGGISRLQGKVEIIFANSHSCIFKVLTRLTGVGVSTEQGFGI